MVPDSPAGTGFPQVRPEDAPEFLEHFLRVVSESRRTTSYKLILVLSLLDAVKLTSPAAGLPTRLPVRHLAERAIQILWPQVRPFNDLALRQMSGAKGTAKIPEAVARLRSRTGESLGRLRCSPAGEARYQETVREIAWLLVWWPIPRLQTVLGEVVEFLWPVPHSWRGIGNDKLPDAAIDRDEAGYPVLWLFPGVADLLIRVGGLLRPHVEDTWTLQVADWNNLRQDPSLALRSHLFPNADRSSLPDSLRELLIAIHHGHCFWCERSVDRKAVHIDHVVPWIECRNDAFENLVVAHERCNLSKLEWLVSPRLLSRYLDYLREKKGDLAELSATAEWYTDLPYTTFSVLSAYRKPSFGDLRVWDLDDSKTPTLSKLDFGDVEPTLAGFRSLLIGQVAS